MQACILMSSIKKYNMCAHVYIMHSQLTESEKQSLLLISSVSFSVILISVNNEELAQYKVSEKWPAEIYFRLLCPKYLPETLNRVLYLDCDILVRSSLEELYSTQLDGKPLAAVEDVLSPNIGMLENLGMTGTSKYFNSGVLLIDLAAWRKSELSSSVFCLLDKYSSRFIHPDQDALNIVFENNWHELHYRWNYLRGYQNTYLNKETLYSDYEKKTIKYPAIIHFSGPKPWKSKNRSLFKYEYHQQMIESGYRNYVPRLTLYDWCEKVGFYILDKLNIKSPRPNNFY
jgi:lipopolysaccharide biosynthesis glycosyltransferase